MLIVETYIDVSPGKGIGLFAKEYIAKGSVYWVRDENFDKIFLQNQLEQYPKLASDFIKIHGFLEQTGDWYLCGDNARFSNHSRLPNTENHFDYLGRIQYSIATENISPGNEIFCDYTKTCLTCKDGVSFEVSAE